MRRVVIVMIQIINSSENSTFFTFCVFGDLKNKRGFLSKLSLCLNSTSNNIHKKPGKKSIISRLEGEGVKEINCKNSIKEVREYFSAYKILNIYEQKL